jgi:exopolysaccharide biosynthesis protein
MRPWTPAALQVIRTTVHAGGRAYAVQAVKVRLDSVRLQVGLAGGRVGAVAPLAEIAARPGTVAAINGSYFEAYTEGPIKVPNHTLITGGRVVHKGTIGTVIGFTDDNEVLLDRLTLKIEGATNGSYHYPDNWWAYWINRLPTTPDSVILFTPDWGAATGVPDGTQVVVSGGRVTRVGIGSQIIPRDGCVIYLRGNEEQQAQKFRPGRSCEYRVVREGRHDLGDWERVREAVGAGPRLLTSGRITVDSVGEGFSHAKILTMSAGRSLVGVTADGWLILATSSGTVAEMAGVMKALGARDAMSMDGGASSGLWAEGRSLVTPGRMISNALLVLKR